MHRAITLARCALQVSQPLRDPSASQDEDLEEFERECIARAVTGEAEPEPSVYFLGGACACMLQSLNEAIFLYDRTCLFQAGARQLQGCRLRRRQTLVAWQVSE